MNKKILILVLACVIAVSAIAAVSATGQAVNFGDFNLTIDGSISDNQTSDEVSIIEFNGTKDQVDVMIMPGSFDESKVMNNFESDDTLEKVDDVNGFSIFKNKNTSDAHQYQAVKVIPDKDAVVVFFNDLDNGKAIVKTFAEN